MSRQRAYKTLQFWRDIEILNIPKTPKCEGVYRQRTLVQKVAVYERETTLPWQSGHALAWTGSGHSEWTHIVYLGVAKQEYWACMALQAACPGHQLTEDDKQRLGGSGWIAAFAVNSRGQIIADSYTPASFAVGLQRLLRKQSLEGVSAALQDLRQQFQARHTRTESTAGAPASAQLASATAPATPAPTPQPPSALDPIGWCTLIEELQHIIRPLGAAAQSLLLSIIIQSSRRQTTSTKDDVDIDFLNSFFLDDLDRLILEAGHDQPLGRALHQYLGDATTAGDRVDILARCDAMIASASPAKLSLGRWPAKSSHHLMLAQQAAVGEMLAQLRDNAGLVAVNGPPGTGKTTLLCDVVADIVVQRAQALAKLESPADAFGPKATMGGMQVHPFRPKIVDGTGIVVASSNNAAVENITKELPAMASIEVSEYSDASHFQEAAALAFREAGITTPAWGLVAAALGNKRNRGLFAKVLFYRDESWKAGQPCDLRTIVRHRPHDGLTYWKRAKQQFSDEVSRVEKWRHLCISVEQAMRRQETLECEMQTARGRHDRIKAQLDEAQARWTSVSDACRRQVAQARADLDAASSGEGQSQLVADGATDRLEAARSQLAPRFWDRWLAALGIITQRMRSWQTAVRDLLTERARACDALQAAMGHRRQRERSVAQCQQRIANAKDDHQRTMAALSQHLRQAEQSISGITATIVGDQRCIRTFKEKGGKIPKAEFFKQPTAAEAADHLTSLWVTDEFDRQRAQTFLAALRLHEAVLLCCKEQALANLKAIWLMLRGETPESLQPSHRIAVWNMLFFAVPVVSSTLASFHRLFIDCGRESLGWLLIDEAGQATPQSVAGALWRSRRAVIIGDPQQIEPVMTVPSAIIGQRRECWGVDVCWSPATQSAQTVADRTMRIGAYIGDVWTGLPLRAHRRCIDPMFRVANAIAYNGQMVQATTNPDPITCPLGDSAWLHVRGLTHDKQVVTEEMKALEKCLRDLREDPPRHGNNRLSKIFIVSPFRLVAEACRDVVDCVGIEHGDYKVKCGTVHAFQGSQAEVVIFVLGSAPGQTGYGSREWASKRPNILNVALTRAKLRFYVIGNADDWWQFPFFKSLIEDFRQHHCIRDVTPRTQT